jgi:ribosomal protein L37AE/L43A
MSDHTSGFSCPHCDKGTLRNTTTVKAGEYTRVRRVKCDHCGAVCSILAFVVDTPGSKQLATNIRNGDTKPALAGRRIYPIVT